MNEKYKFWQYLIPYNISKYSMGLARSVGHGKLNLKNISRNIKTGSEPQSVYLLDRDRQKRYMLRQGYTMDNTDNYGLVKKAVGNRKLPIYKTPGLSYDDNHMNVIGNVTVFNDKNWLGTSGGIVHGGSYPTALYYNDKDNYFYQRGWDLNDYGGDENKQSESNYSRYDNFKKKSANILDFIGNPMVISTGYRKTPFNLNDILLDEQSTRLYDYNNVYAKSGIYTDKDTIDILRQQFNTWLKKHKGSSIIDPYTTTNNPYTTDSRHMYRDYALDKNGDIIYNDDGSPRFNYDKDKKEIHQYMIVNTTKIPEVIAKRKRRLLGGIY